MTATDIEKIMNEKNLSQEYSALLDVLHELGAKPLSPTIINLNFTFPPKTNQAVVGIWPYESSAENGICISYDYNKLSDILGIDRDESELPGIRNRNKIGFLGANRFLKNIEEIYAFKDYFQEKTTA